MKRLAFVIGIASILLGCVRGPSDAIEQDGKQGSGETATVTFRVKVPGLNRGATRGIDAALENDINSLAVFVGQESGEGFAMDRFFLFTQGQFEMLDATTAGFQLPLELTMDRTRVVVAANIPESEWPFFLEMTDEQKAEYGALPFSEWRVSVPGAHNICDHLVDAADGQIVMTGEVTLPQVSPSTRINAAIPLIRYVARADIQLNLGEDSKPFVPTSVEIWRGNSISFYMPTLASLDDPDNPTRVVKAIAPFDELKPGNEFSANYGAYFYDREEETGLFSHLYLAESERVDDIYRQTDTAPCIIVGGKYNGSSTVTYYRIDFNAGGDMHPFGQIMRNWRYVFDITKVTSAGFKDAQTAATSVANSMQVEVQMWDESVQQVNFLGSGGYMYINTNDVKLEYNQGANSSFVVRSTEDFLWQIDENAGKTSNSGEMPQTLSNEFYSITMTAGQESDGYRDYTFVVTALSDNEQNGNTREAGVFIAANEAILSTKITQKWMSVTDRKVHVLSLSSELGTMGIYYEGGSNNTGTTPMRTILTNSAYFGPNGTVKFGGFTFDRYQSGNISATSSVSMDEFKRALESTDILILPYASNPPQVMVDAINKWTTQKYHVLFVFCDSGITSTGGTATNVLLRKSLNDGLTWYPASDLSAGSTGNNTKMQTNLGYQYLYTAAGGAHVVGYYPYVAINGLMMADQTEENSPFMAGPFGLPDQGATSTTSSYQMWDSITEWAIPSATSSVTPLAVFQAQIWGGALLTYSVGVKAKTNAMLIGVDQARTTVYIGESQIFTSFLNNTPPYDNHGLSGTPYFNSMSVLLSNVWAWAVKNVLAQVEKPYDE